MGYTYAERKRVDSVLSKARTDTFASESVVNTLRSDGWMKKPLAEKKVQRYGSWIGDQSGTQTVTEGDDSVLAPLSNTSVSSVKGPMQAQKDHRGNPHEFRQIPAAETEADSLSDGMNVGSTPESVKSAMGERMGADFSGVRFHTEKNASLRADAIGARAYTSGSDVFFGSEGFNPAVAAHELVHTVQQGTVAGDVPTLSVPSGSIQMLPWKKKTPQPSPASSEQTPADINTVPGRISLGRYETLKKGEEAGTSVAKVNSIGPNGRQVPAVLKMGVNPELERIMASFYIAAGKRFDEKHGGMWSFDSPAVRSLDATERNQASPIVQKGDLRDLSRGKFAPANREDLTDDELKDALDHIAIFSMVNGNSRETLPEPKKWKKTTSFNPKDSKENADYQRMMGYIAMMDMVIGNTDRLVGVPSLNNWLEDRDARKAHLIDNDYSGSNGLRKGEKGRNSWLYSLLNHAGDSGDIMTSSATYLREACIGDRDIADVLGKNRGGKDARTGIAQAVSDMPALRIKMIEQFNKENEEMGRTEMTEYQKELLERMQITYEVMCDTQMAKVYSELQKIGLSPSEGEPAEKTQRRAELLKKRDEFRQASMVPAVESNQSNSDQPGTSSAHRVASAWDSNQPGTSVAHRLAAKLGSKQPGTSTSHRQKKFSPHISGSRASKKHKRKK